MDADLFHCIIAILKKILHYHKTYLWLVITILLQHLKYSSSYKEGHE